MKCPKCRSKIIDGVCIKCGYMKDGISVKINYDYQKSDLELYEKDYDKMIHNKGLLKPYLLGCLYIGYKGHLITGVLLSFIELIAFYYVYRFFEAFAFNYQMIFGFIMTLILWIFIRLILSGVLNSFILYLDKKSIEQIRKNNPKNYKVILVNHNSSRSFLLLMNIVICIFLFVIFLVVMSIL